MKSVDTKIDILTRKIKPKIAGDGGRGGNSDWVSGDGVQWLFYFVKSYRSFRKYSFS